jgi:hypothetical protein
MYKLNSLRSYLMQQVPGLRDNPDRLQVFIEQPGSLWCAAQPGAAVSAFQYSYQAECLVTDFSLHPDTLIVPVLEWVAQHEPDLLLSRDACEQGIHWESDILSDQLIDIKISLRLTERVTISIENGHRTIRHHTEPQLDPPATIPESWQIIMRHPDGTEDIALEWQVTPNQPAPQP